MYPKSVPIGVSFCEVLSSVIIRCTCVLLHLFDLGENGCLRPAIFVPDS